MNHQNDVFSILNKDKMNTPDRIFPSSVVAEHTNQIRRMNMSFKSVVAKLKKTHTAALSSGGGYYTDMD